MRNKESDECQQWPGNNLILGIKTEPVAVGADATVFSWFMGHGNRGTGTYISRTYTVASTPAVAMS